MVPDFFVGRCIERMKVIQSLNQNALLVRGEESECIVVGKGIGFGKKKGDIVNRSLIKKTYRMAPERTDLLNLLGDVEEESIQMAEEVTEYAQQELGKEFTGNFILSLASHIQFLEEKYEAQIDIPKPFHYELKYLYPQEYQVAEWSVDYLNLTYTLKLPEAEISFFTLHFVNASIDQGEMDNVVELSDILNEIVELMEQELGHSLDRETIDFSRFIIHLRYFVIRNFNQKERKEEIYDKELKQLYKMALNLYPLENKILTDIKTMLEREHQMHFGSSEGFYLLLHLVRIISKKGGEKNEF